jgi:hypothetical protein
MMSATRFTMAATTLLAVLAASTPAQPPRGGVVAVSDDGWERSGEGTGGRRRGRDALRFGSGAAYHPARRFRDGTIEFDVAMSPRRTFVGVRFRAQSREVWEEVYLRPHKSNLPDALQYAPAFAGGRSNWQLYHGPGDTAAATLAHGRWVHVKLVVKGRQAALFLGDHPAPALVMPRLGHEPAEGFIGFSALDASAERGKDFPSAISNVVIRPGVAEFAFPEPPAAAMPPGVITSWEVSEAFAPGAGPLITLPVEVVNGAWHQVAADPSGLVPLDRFVNLPATPERVAALARVTIRASEPAAVPFSFGYSDDASVFLNRRMLFSGVNGYSFNFPRRDGLITADHATVSLPLRAGENELVLGVSDAFGGWGFVGRIGPRAGVSVTPSR